MLQRKAIVQLRFVLGISALTLSLMGCPPGNQPARDGGRACSSVAQCNANGATCGTVFDCVLGYCANETMVRACTDGGYPPSDSSSGECLQSEDCNPPNACGPIIACINFNCDRNGPRIEIPCVDSGMTSGDTGVAPIDVQSMDANNADVPASFDVVGE